VIGLQRSIRLSVNAVVRFWEGTVLEWDALRGSNPSFAIVNCLSDNAGF
jgi:hypothetical protein